PAPTPPEAAVHKRGDEDENGRQGRDRPAARLSFALAGDAFQLYLPSVRDPVDDARGAREETQAVRAVPELRHHVLAARFAGVSIRDPRLEPVPDLHPDFPLLDRQEDQ